MMIAMESACCATHGSAEAADVSATETAHVSATKAANGASKSPTAMTASTMTTPAATRLRVARKQAASHSGGR
jgi:hypothetical protein